MWVQRSLKMQILGVSKLLSSSVQYRSGGGSSSSIINTVACVLPIDDSLMADFTKRNLSFVCCGNCN